MGVTGGGILSIVFGMPNDGGLGLLGIEGSTLGGREPYCSETNGFVLDMCCIKSFLSNIYDIL